MTDKDDDPRGAARMIVMGSLDADLWRKNERFTGDLIEAIRAHRLHNHPIIEAWERREFTLEALREVHLEARAGFLEVFMESLLRLMQTCSQIERRLGPRAKIAARFLIQLNVLDELGFVPGQSSRSGFKGHPSRAHYWQLMDTLTALGAPPETWWRALPSGEAAATRAVLDDNQDDHLRLAVVLATIETVFMPYYGPWARNTLHVCGEADVEDGYHTIHVEHDDGHFVDDDHSEDSWYIVRQALTPDRYGEVEELTSRALDTWARLMDALVEKNLAFKAAA